MEKQQGTMKSNGGVAHVHAPMTRGERLELAKLLRVRARVAKADVEQKGARQLADVEAQLASRFKADDARWAAITARAQQMVEKADAEIARLSEESGIRKEFRPSIRLGWFDRGENSVTKRRAELRRVAVSEIESRVKAAKVEIDRQEAALQTQLVSGGLESSAAQAFLESMPSIDDLMPPLSVGMLEDTWVRALSAPHTG